MKVIRWSVFSAYYHYYGTAAFSHFKTSDIYNF